MALSTRTIVHNFSNADGTPASGSIVFQLSKRMTNGSSTVMPGEVTATLNGSGALSQSLTANNDAGTIPADAQWQCTLRISGAEVESYWITVPAGTGSVDLGVLLPQNTTGG